MAIKPITGMLRRGLVLDLSVAGGLGVTSGYGWWYGYHVPAVRHRDAFYSKLEDERAKALGQVGTAGSSA
ncbi:cytochrome c oxidase family protein-like protein [Trichodelitschia bisporula]|uniref:Cytochrome c oxidase subunit 9, mitochondrial n=1 Tax=Trichodelitschia bisporula TaxID=703511 RepID=A0A6G1HWX3_9PEZI|nr:cytochrome c oxidase family protein-like protein [Trichodelitschia bisporula]